MPRANGARTVVAGTDHSPKGDLGASQLTHEQLRGITCTSNDAVASLAKPYKWLHSYVAGDKVYCLHQAENAEVIREHARRGGFPANLVAEFASVFDSTGPRDLPT